MSSKRLKQVERKLDKANRDVSAKPEERFCSTCTKKQRKQRKCKTKVKAEYYCAGCLEFFCDKCLQAHKEEPHSSEHAIIGISEFESIGEESKREEHFKSEHSADVESIEMKRCERCYINVCETCKDMSESNTNAQGNEGVLYKVEKKSIIKAKWKTEKGGCHIATAIMLNDGTILLSDFSSRRIKRVLPGRSKVHDYIDVAACPCGMCVINQEEIVVTLPGLNHLQYISLGDSMTITKTLTIDCACRCIIYHDEKLFLADYNGTVYVYTLEGEQQRNFCTDDEGETMFGYIRNIAVNATGNILFVADEYKGFIAIDTGTGQKLWTYNKDDLKQTSCVCLDGLGNVFVCGLGSYNVLQFQENGVKIGELITAADGMVLPAFISYDSNTSCLIVTQDFKREVITFKLLRE